MKVAVFTGTDEVIVLAVKGSKKSMESIDGLRDWFDLDEKEVIGRHISNYDVKLCHLGTTEGLLIESRVRSEGTGRETNIEDWFPESCFHG